jgi:hypothetical protein
MQEYSSKMMSKDNERGMGLGSNIKMITEGYGGEILIASGGGLVIFGGGKNEEKGERDEYLLSQSTKFQGTLISIRLPLIKREIDLYAYTSV